MTNVALVVFDTLRKDSFDEHFDWLPGVRYESAWSTSGWTVPAHGSLFAGRYPSETGVYAKSQSLSCPEPVLAEALSEAGYTTRGFSANANISDAFEFTRGFDEFEHSWRGQRRDEDVIDWGDFITRTKDDGPSRYVKALLTCLDPDVNTTKSIKLGLQMKARDLEIDAIAGADDGASRVLDLVRETDFGDSEFFFANLMEAHTPYNPPDEYQTVDLDENPSFGDTIGDGPDADPADIRQAYDDCVRYLSDVYEEIFAELTEDFDYVVTVSDHGEMFGTDGIWEHNRGLYPQLTHVPLTVWRGEEEFSSRTETVGLIDIHRTILDLAGVEDADSGGSNLLEDDESRRHFVERHGLRASRVENLRDKGLSEAEIQRYDADTFGCVFADGSYGWETDDGIKTDGDVTEADVTEAIDELRDALDVRAVDGEGDGDVPDDVQDRLEELGYA